MDSLADMAEDRSEVHLVPAFGQTLEEPLALQVIPSTQNTIIYQQETKTLWDIQCCWFVIFSSV